MTSDFSIYTQDYLETAMLSRVSDTVDKREGSIIWDTTAPVSAEFETYYNNLTEVQKRAYASTATGAYLDFKVAEVGLTRYASTYAYKRVDFKDDDNNPLSVTLNTKFSTISSTVPINYTITSVYLDENDAVVAGAYIAVCDELGTIGNGYTGNMLPISYVANLSSAIMSTLITPARDTETDDELRVRYFEKINTKSFGGNIADYKETITAIAGVGGVQVYPVWDGGGTVLCSIADTTFEPASVEFIEQVQNLVDPLAINSVPTTGMGLGTAPIGHKVTITTCTTSTTTIEATVTLENGYTIGQVKPLIDEALADYFNTMRSNWDVGNELNEHNVALYQSRVLAIIIGVAGVANVTNVLINGLASDKIYTETSATQQMPKLGTVTINVV